MTAAALTVGLEQAASAATVPVVLTGTLKTIGVSGVPLSTGGGLAALATGSGLKLLLAIGVFTGGITFAVWQGVAVLSPSRFAGTNPNAAAAPLGETIRVGVLVSQTAATTSIDPDQTVIPGYFRQLGMAEVHLAGPRYEVVLLVEPGTENDPAALVNRGLADRPMVSATDPEAWAGLDLIYLGHHTNIREDVLAPLVAAIESGVPMYTNDFTGGNRPGVDHPLVMRINLARPTPLGSHHNHEGGGWLDERRLVEADVLATHPTIPGFSPGQTVYAFTCAWIFEPVASAVLLIHRPQTVPVTDHNGQPRTADPPTGQMPVMVVGQIGQGRVVLLALGSGARTTIRDFPENDFDFEAITAWLLNHKTEG